MTRRRIQALLILNFIAWLGMSATAQSQLSSQLRSTQAVLGTSTTTKLHLPRVQFQYGALPKANLTHQATPSRQQPQRRPRQITPEIASILAPPANHRAQPIPTQDNHPNTSRSNYLQQTRMGYHTNPYATDTTSNGRIRQVSTDVPDTTATNASFGTPVYEEFDPSIPDPFGALEAVDFPPATRPTPLDMTQDPEDPFQQRSRTQTQPTNPQPQVQPRDSNSGFSPQPRSTSQTQPRIAPGPQDPQDPFQQRTQTNPRSNSPTPLEAQPDRSTGQQDPTDPFQQRPDRTPQQNQDTQPRPLPGETTDPTDLPIPPRDRNVPDSPNRDTDVPFDPSTQQERAPFIYPDEAYPGRQTYPGPTASFERPQPNGEATPTNTSQVIYPPRSREMAYPPQQQGLMDQALMNFDPSTEMPIQGNPLGFDQPSGLGEYQGIVQPYPTPDEHYARPDTTHRPPDGWRPQLAIGEDLCSDQCYDSCCFEPLFYLAGFGGFSLADNLDGGLPGIDQPAISFNMDDGASFGLALGQYQGRNLRTELEYAFRHNDIESLQLTERNGAGLNLTSYDLSGEVKSHSGMANLIWQFDTPGGRWVNPYVGAGVGFVFLEAEAQRGGQNVLADGVSGNSSFGYQLFAGINTQLSSSLDVFVEYRHFSADELRLNPDLAAANAGFGTYPGSYDYSTDNVHFGFRFKF